MNMTKNPINAANLEASMNTPFNEEASFGHSEANQCESLNKITIATHDDPKDHSTKKVPKERELKTSD